MERQLKCSGLSTFAVSFVDTRIKAPRSNQWVQRVLVIPRRTIRGTSRLLSSSYFRFPSQEWLSSTALETSKRAFSSEYKSEEEPTSVVPSAGSALASTGSSFSLHPSLSASPVEERHVSNADSAASAVLRLLQSTPLTPAESAHANLNSSRENATARAPPPPGPSSPLGSKSPISLDERKAREEENAVIEAGAPFGDASASQPADESVIAPPIRSRNEQEASAAASHPSSFSSYAALQRVERRRSKRSVNETEFAAGISERLCPKMARVTALHEVHFSDAVVREIDSGLYFSHGQPYPSEVCLADESTRGLLDSTEKKNSDKTKEHLLKECWEEEQPRTRATAALSDEAFESFDIDSLFPDEDASSKERTEPTVASEGPLTEGEKVRLPSVEVAPQCIPFGLDPLPKLLQQMHGATSETSSNPDLTLPLVVRYSPHLPPSDCLCLMHFLLFLRNQTVTQLPLQLHRLVERTEKFVLNKMVLPTDLKESVEEIDIDEVNTDSKIKASPPSVSASPSLLQLPDIITYLDHAPPPVRAFTEDLRPLKEEGVALTAPYACKIYREEGRPAFLFTFYVENVSVQNAIGHICMLFSIPVQSFHTRTQPGKMTCSSVRCALAPGLLSRHHLLLLNTLRHPGFVIRVGDILPVPEVRPGVAKDLTDFFGSLARWQPIYFTEILLRRIRVPNNDYEVEEKPNGDFTNTKDPRAKLQARLDAIQQIGAVHYCSNRDTSLARAASDVIHGYYKSAFLHALQRSQPPLAMQQFFQAPNEVTASKARSASTDSTIRAALKCYLQENGVWNSAVQRLPYAWRRRWINALRSICWNQMASTRIRYNNRHGSAVENSSLSFGRVIVGDVVVKPEYRQDARRRQVLTLTQQYVKLVETEEEARHCRLEDVFIPFLRGKYPLDFFASEDSNHPVMRRSVMMALLKKRSAAALLVGLPPSAQSILDIRSEASPLLFRRLLIRPLAMEAKLLEDKPPVIAVQQHYDAARLLRPDRWPRHEWKEKASSCTGPVSPDAELSEVEDEIFSVPLCATQDPQPSTPMKSHSDTQTRPSSPPTRPYSLIPQSLVLDRSTMGKKLPAGVLPSEFFTPPSPSDYLVLGQTHRFEPHSRHSHPPNLSDNEVHSQHQLLPSAPLTPPAELPDRIFTLHIKAICHSTAVGLQQILREYFILIGVRESEERGGRSASHSSTGMPTGSLPTSQMDDVLQHKIHRLWRELDPETSLLTATDYCPVCFNRDHISQEHCAEYIWKRQQQRRLKEAMARVRMPEKKAGSETRLLSARELRKREKMEEAKAKENVEPHEPLPPVVPAKVNLSMHWKLRRSSRLSNWGVRFVKSSLALTGADHPAVIVEASLSAICQPLNPLGQEEGDPFLGDLQDFIQRWITSGPASLTGASSGEDKSKTLLPSLQHFLKEIFETPQKRSESNPYKAQVPLPLEGLHRLMQKKAAASEGLDNDEGVFPVRECQWRLTEMEGRTVHEVREIAEVFLACAHQRELTLVFSAPTIHVGTSLAASEEETRSRVLLPLKGVRPCVVGDEPVLAKTSHPSAASLNVSGVPHKKGKISVKGKKVLPKLPSGLSLHIYQPLRPAKDSAPPSWGVRIHAQELEVLNLQSWIEKAYTWEQGGCQGNPPLKITSSTPPPSDLFFSSWAELLYLHYDPSNPDAGLVESSFNDFLHYYVVHRVNKGRVTCIDGVRRGMSQVPTTALMRMEEEAPLLLELRLRHRPREKLEEKYNHHLESMEMHNKILSEISHSVHLTLMEQQEEVKSEKEVKPEPLFRVKPKDDIITEKAEVAGEPDADTCALAEVNKEEKGRERKQQHLLQAQQLNMWKEDICTCPSHQRFLPGSELVARLATIAVHRPVSERGSPALPTRWGIRLQKRSLRLLQVENRHGYHFHVYAYTNAQIRRMERSLRPLVVPSDPRLTSEKSSLKAYRFHLYMVEEVNHKSIHSPEECRNALKLASLGVPQTSVSSETNPVLSAPLSLEGEEGSHAPVAVKSTGTTPQDTTPVIKAEGEHKSYPEVVLLRVRDYPLLRIPLQIVRGTGLSSFSVFSPVGIHVDLDVCVVRFSPSSPAVSALSKQSVGPNSSLWSLVKEAKETEESTELGALDLCALENKFFSICTLPSLIPPLLALVHACSKGEEKATTAALPQSHSQRFPSFKDYLVDDDEKSSEIPNQIVNGAAQLMEDKVEAFIAADEHQGLEATTRPTEPSAVSKALREVWRTIDGITSQLQQCSQVDGLQVLQLEALKNALHDHFPDDGSGDTSVNHGGCITLKEVVQYVSNVQHLIRWRVVYAERAKKIIHSAADLAEVLSPGVAEEVIVLQQCVLA